MNEPGSRTPLLLLPGTRVGRDPERSIPRGPRRVPAEAVAATQRDRLLDGIVRTVAEKGYAHARVSDICRAAGVTRPVFYELFDGKQDAVLAAHRHGTRLLLRAMDDAFGAEDAWPAAIRAGLTTLLGILAEAPAFATMAVVEIDAVGPAGRAELTRLLARFHRFFREAPTADLPVPKAELVAAVVGGAHAALHRRIDAGRVHELPDLLPTLTYYVLSPFLGPRAAREALTGPDPADRTSAARGASRGPSITDAKSTPYIHKWVDQASTPG